MLGFLRGPIRFVLGVAERTETDVVAHSPLAETRELEDKLSEAVAAIHRAADSLESHVAVVEALASSLPPLTESVTRLTDQLGELLQLTAPLASAEREVSRIEQFFGRHRHEEGPR
jgi:ABC-type transporter Mla subunit MlaD